MGKESVSPLRQEQYGQGSLGLFGPGAVCLLSLHSNSLPQAWVETQGWQGRVCEVGWTIVTKSGKQTQKSFSDWV